MLFINASTLLSNHKQLTVRLMNYITLQKNC